MTVTSSESRHNPRGVLAVHWLTAGSSSLKPRTLLRVYLSPSGWRVIGEGYRIPPSDWIEMSGVEYTFEDHQEGRVVLLGVREVKGFDWTAPVDFAEWSAPSERFEVGADAWGTGWASVRALRDDCSEFRSTGKCVRRRVARENDKRVTWT